ncbi:MAG: sporulation integral membrane protein YtvI [Oscillospiraceae bacterium]|jgi:sporulation integral membrane protein YtvI|nr:sporulation integral membrane protein YtvI [Oscillospiraceae bacterium]
MWERLSSLNNRSNDLLRKSAIVLAMLGLVAVISLLLPYVAPFIVALALAAVIEPLVKLLSRLFGRMKTRRAVAAAICTALLLALILLSALALSTRVFSELRGMALTLPRNVAGGVTSAMAWLDERLEEIDLIDDETRAAIRQLIITLGSSITSAASAFASSLARGLWNTATVTVPQALLFTTLAFMGTFYLSADKDRIIKFLCSLMPAGARQGSAMIKANLFRGLVGQLRAQLIMLLVTFTELSIGFSLIQMEYIMLLAAVIAILDALPIIGTGLFLIPMSIAGFFASDFRRGVGYLLLYVIIGIVRQTLEPRLIGRSIGLHPLATMMSMYASYRAIGLTGMIIGPILLMMIMTVLTYLTNPPSPKPNAKPEIVITIPRLTMPRRKSKRFPHKPEPSG